VDVGSGTGFAAAAATRKFKEVYATDFRIDIVESNLKLLNVNGVLLERTLLPKVEEVDCFFLWHVMEHLKDPLTVLKEMASQLAEEGCVIFQVPLFRKENTFDQHFHFYSANTIRVLAKKAGLIFHKLEFDLDLAYMTCVLKK
jgi:2-polyprenyl-3-methyl-5-hydroxy-6-metoxy-1,4-benzoquinol methylase